MNPWDPEALPAGLSLGLPEAGFRERASVGDCPKRKRGGHGKRLVRHRSQCRSDHEYGEEEGTGLQGKAWHSQSLASARSLSPVTSLPHCQEQLGWAEPRRWARVVVLPPPPVAGVKAPPPHSPQGDPPAVLCLSPLLCSWPD